MSLTYNQAVEQTITAGEQIHQIVNGTATTEVTVEDGSKVPSIRKALLDNFYFKDPIAWQVGQTENVFNQLRQFTDGSWWYAPSATASNPISMGSTPVGDALWKIYDFDAIGKLEPRIDEALRRSYAEAGYNVVGTFQEGFTYVNTNDVGIDKVTGKGYTGPAGPVAAGTDPTSGGFVDRSDDVRVSGSIDAIQFGVDPSGTLPSDAQLLAALQFSAATGIEIVVSGKCRLTQTMLQPANSIVRVDGIVFCENPAGLTNNLLWDVSGPNDTGCRTEIRTMTLSTSPSTGAAVVDRLMKPIRISTARVKCGLIKTYGFQLGGPELGPTGYEINVAESTSGIKKWDPAHRDACGFKITTTDCEIGSVITTNYPVAPKLGSTNHINSVHCWGLPATAANEYPNAQMLTGPTLGAATVVDYIYVDSLDTDGYNTTPSANEGVGVIFSGYECSVGNLLYRIHPQTKPGKVKLARFTGFSNVVQALQVPGGGGFDTASPIIYDNDAARWRNRINSSNVHSSVNVFQYGTSLAPSGFTAFTGYITVEKVSHDAVIRLYLDATAVDNSSTSDFVINLPAGLTLMQGSTTIVSQRTCLGMSSTDHTLTHDFAYVDSQSKIRIGYRKRDTGQMFFLKQTSLKPGNIELVLRASITNQM